MKVLVTGHDGYIGSVMTPLLAAAGHEVVGLDTGLFHAFTLGDEAPPVATIAKDLPGFEPQWTVQRGIEELLAAYGAHGLTIEDFLSSRFQRIMRIRELLDAGELDDDLRWT